jgi:hypothetical protein
VLYLRFTFIPLDIDIFLNNPCLALNLFRLEGLSGLWSSYLRLSSSFKPWRLGDYRLYIVYPVFLSLYKVLSDPLFGSPADLFPSYLFFSWFSSSSSFQLGRKPIFVHFRKASVALKAFLSLNSRVLTPLSVDIGPAIPFLARSARNSFLWSFHWGHLKNRWWIVWSLFGYHQHLLSSAFRIRYR